MLADSSFGLIFAEYFEYFEMIDDLGEGTQKAKSKRAKNIAFVLFKKKNTQYRNACFSIRTPLPTGLRHL